MDVEELERALKDVQYPGWRWQLSPLYYDGREITNGFLLRGAFARPDRDTGKMGTGFSRWEYLAGDCTEDSLVKTCWVLIKLTIEHEAMEFFMYGGKRVFDPHTPVSALTGLQGLAQAAPPGEAAPEDNAQRILGDLPPMSFQEAKAVLYPHLETPNYLTQALKELDAMQTTKAIKTASGNHLMRAAKDFESREKR